MKQDLIFNKGATKMQELKQFSQIKRVLKRFLDSYILGPSDNARVAKILIMFEENCSFSLNYFEVARTIFPSKDYEKTLADMRKFLTRIRNAVKTAKNQKGICPKELMEIKIVMVKKEKRLKIFTEMDIAEIISRTMIDNVDFWYPEHESCEKNLPEPEIYNKLQEWFTSHTASPILVLLDQKEKKTAEILRKFCLNILKEFDKCSEKTSSKKSISVPLWLKFFYCDLNLYKPLPYIEEILQELVKRQFNLDLDTKLLQEVIYQKEILPVVDLRYVESNFDILRFGILVREIKKMIYEKGVYRNRLILLLPKDFKFLQDQYIDIHTLILGPRYTDHRYPYEDKDLIVIG